MRILRVTAIVSAIVLIWAAALAVLVHIVQAHINPPEVNNSPEVHSFALVGYSAALVALAGWMIQAGVAVRNSRKQHTMNVLLQTRLNPQFGTHVRRIDALFPDGGNIAFQVITRPENRKVLEAVRWMLNYYEFVANGIRHGDLDERLMRDCFCTQFCTFCSRADDVIRNVREEDPFGRASLAKHRVLRSLRQLQRRWQKKINRSQLPRWWRC